MPTLEKFNKTTIENSVLPLQSKMESGTQQYFWHPKVSGLGLKLTPTKAVYIVQRRVADGRNVRCVIGGYRELTVEQAEQEASRLRNEMRSGVDPVKAKQAKRLTGKTLKQLLEDYLKRYDSRLRPKTKDVYRGAVLRCFKEWLDRPITEIKAPEVELKQIALSDANGPRGKGEAQANQAMRVLRTLFNFAMLEYKDAKQMPIITINPVSTLRQRRLWNVAKTRDEIIEDDELADWYEAVLTLENETVRDYMLLCLFTGLRRSEAACLKWENVKLSGKKPSLTIPAAMTKTNSEHQLPLPDFLVSLLDVRAKVRKIDNPYVFPGTKANSHIVEPKRAIAKVIEVSGVDFSMHTLRRTFGTIAGKLDIAHYKHKKLMNHSTKQDVTGAHYVKLTTEDLREPMQKICDHIKKHAGIDVEAAKPENEVVS